MKNTGDKNWTEYEKMLRTQLRLEGMSASQIAVVLGRTREAVNAFEDRNGLSNGDRPAPWHPLRDNKKLLAVLA